MNIYIDEVQASILLRLLNGESINNAEKRELIEIMMILESQPSNNSAC